MLERRVSREESSFFILTHLHDPTGSISKMNDLSKNSVTAAVTFDEVDEKGVDQRIDNYLVRLLKGVPKSHVYLILRTGQVRVNSRRVEATYRLQMGDRLRIPPLRRPAAGPTSATAQPVKPILASRVLLEDDFLIALAKPAGLAAHGGSGISRGLIEQMRLERPELRFLELVHRLDRETSGVILLAKKRSALVALHEQIRAGRMQKRYRTLVAGRWTNERQSVRLALRKTAVGDGDRRVFVDPEGLASHTIFHRLEALPGFTLLEAELKTGRTHQIRVHLQHLGFPIAGDDKYGDFALNRELARSGLKRMFLHAAQVSFQHPGKGEVLSLDAPLAEDLESFLQQLRSWLPDRSHE